MLSAFCFILSTKKKIANPFKSSQDIIPRITSRDAKVWLESIKQNALQELGENHLYPSPSRTQLRFMTTLRLQWKETKTFKPSLTAKRSLNLNFSVRKEGDIGGSHEVHSAVS